MAWKDNTQSWDSEDFPDQPWGNPARFIAADFAISIRFKHTYKMTTTTLLELSLGDFSSLDSVAGEWVAVERGIYDRRFRV